MAITNLFIELFSAFQFDLLLFVFQVKPLTVTPTEISNSNLGPSSTEMHNYNAITFGTSYFVTISVKQVKLIALHLTAQALLRPTLTRHPRSTNLTSLMTRTCPWPPTAPTASPTRSRSRCPVCSRRSRPCSRRWLLPLLEGQHSPLV